MKQAQALYKGRKVSQEDFSKESFEDKHPGQTPRQAKASRPSPDPRSASSKGATTQA